MAARLVNAGERVAGVVMFRSMPNNVSLSRMRSRLDRWCKGRAANRLHWGYRHAIWFQSVWRARSWAGRVGLLFQKLVKLVRVPLGAVTASRDGETLPGDLAAHYTRASSEFIPPRFEGRVAILWPDQEAMPADHALREWRRALPGATIAVVPGDHLSALTVHVGEFAARMRSMLRGMENDGPS